MSDKICMFKSWRRHLSDNLGLIVAIAAAAIALWSAKIQRDALQLDERPYLKVSFESIEPMKTTDRSRTGWSGYDAHVFIEVSGKTPAFSVAARGSCVPEHFSTGRIRTTASRGDFGRSCLMRKQVLNCHVEHDLPKGDLPVNVPFNLTVHYDDIFKHHHMTTFCEIIMTSQGEGTPHTNATGTVECQNFKFQMN